MDRAAQRAEVAPGSLHGWGGRRGLGESLKEVGSWAQASCPPDSQGELAEARCSSLGLGRTALNEDNKTHHCHLPRRLG